MSSLLYGVSEEIYNISDRSFVDDSGYIIHPSQLRPYYRRRSSQSISEPVSVNEATPLNEQVTSFENDGFQVLMNVPHYKPSELTIKTVDNCLVIEGKHRERADEHGFISRQFTRRYTLPEEYDAELVSSTLSADGVLTVKVPAPPESHLHNERTIKIQTQRRNSERESSKNGEVQDPNKK